MKSLSLATSAGVAVLLVGFAAAGLRPPAPSVLMAQADSATPTPSSSFEEQRLADLQTRVAGLSTQVARLGGGDVEALAGRLGGSRSGFDARFGSPVAYVGPSLVQYEVSGSGRVTVVFEEGVATEITVTAPRTAGLDLAEPDPADWTPARASAIAADFAPADADLAPLAAIDVSENPQFVASSAALRQAGGDIQAGACVPAGARGFTMSWSAPDNDHVAAVTLSADPADAPSAPPMPERAGRSTRGASAVANSSLGGVVSVNGLRLQALDVNESQPISSPGGGRAIEWSVELQVENQTRRPIRFDPVDFVLVDADGYELVAVCAGPEPSLANTEVGRGEAVDGWVTFIAPEDFQPQRLVVVTANARVGFSLR
jgi:hypothetical protein